GKQVRTRPLPQHFHDLLPSAGESTRCTAKRLAQGTGNNVDAVHHSTMLRYTAACLAQESGRMAFVAHHNRLISVCEVANLIELRDRTIHGERDVRYNDHLIGAAFAGFP